MNAGLSHTPHPCAGGARLFVVADTNVLMSHMAATERIFEDLAVTAGLEAAAGSGGSGGSGEAQAQAQAQVGPVAWATGHLAAGLACCAVLWRLAVQGKQQSLAPPAPCAGAGVLGSAGGGAAAGALGGAQRAGQAEAQVGGGLL